MFHRTSYLISLCLSMFSCSFDRPADPLDLEAEIIDMNWYSTVKDFYVPENLELDAFRDCGLPDDGVTSIGLAINANIACKCDVGDPAGNRTPNRQLRRLMLYPVELPDQIKMAALFAGDRNDF
jgi:hypothetical protein